MTEQIRKRIEQIKDGHVPEGYKRTVVGIVPIEWEEKELGDLLVFKNGINAEKSKFGSGIKLISVMDILDNSPITYEKIRNAIEIDSEILDSYNVTYGDILFQRSSENFEDAGKSNVYLDKNKIATFSGFVIRGKKNYEYNPYYLNKLLKLSNIRRQIVGLSAGSQHINIGQNSLSKVAVVLASFAEQQRIADILMKWNEAIALQEKLIEKLELQKKALMHKLLTPKDGWRKIEIGKVVNELSVRNKIGCTNILSVSNKSGFIKQEEQFSKQVASKDVGNYKIVSKGNIAYNPSRINVGSIAVYQNDEIGIVSPMYVVMNCNKIDPKLLLLLLDTDRGRYYIKSSLTGSVRDTLNYSDLAMIKISIPLETEMKKIIEIFNKADNNVAVQNKKLTLLKTQQKALMQLLLTGIVRV